MLCKRASSALPAGIGRRVGLSAPGGAAQHHPQLIQRCAPLLGQRPILQRIAADFDKLQSAAAHFDNDCSRV